MEAPVADNLSLAAVRDFGRGAARAPRPRGPRPGDRAARAELGIRAANIARQPVKALSRRQPAEGRASASG